ncbi:unnamed protein product, partial [Porites evermanni]
FLFSLLLANDFIKCDDMNEWKKVGCFQDLVDGTRALPKQLVNIRDQFSKVYQAPLLDWLHVSDSWRRLACECAKKARDKGYKVFGLQFYGECWSDENGLQTYQKFGKANDKKCIMDLLYKNNQYEWKYCDKASDQPCIGEDSTNYVYVLNEEPKSPNDGQWSEWGDWTKCDKTCGTGKQVRERTCTNPPPDPQGKDCQGPGEETQSCNVKECPIDGGFTPWEPVQECSKTCGGGTQKYIRTCTNPPPQFEGKACDGQKEKTEPCKEFACPVPCIRAIDIGVLLDATNSVGKENFVIAKDFVLTLVNSMTISSEESHLGLIVFNINAEILVAFKDLDKQNPSVIKNILKNTTKLKGQTFIDRALRKAGEELFTVAYGERPNKPDVLIVLTDGRTNPASEPYEDALIPLKTKGVKVIAVGVGRNIKKNELIRIAMGKPENVIQEHQPTISRKEVLNRLPS